MGVKDEKTGISGEERTTFVLQRNEQPYTAKLKRSVKGVYSWEIAVSENSPSALLEVLDYLDGELKRRYGGEK